MKGRRDRSPDAEHERSGNWNGRECKRRIREQPGGLHS
jgi:hypothetical protein